MDKGSEVLIIFRAGIVAIVATGMVWSAAQAQTPYPAPTQPYPAPTQPYPAPTQNYPTADQGYPAPSQAYPPAGQSPATGQPYPAPSPAYPVSASPGYPQNYQLNPAYPMVPQRAPQSHFFRDLFAQTIATVLQTTTGGLLGAITGRIMEWFTHRGNTTSGYNAGAYPSAGQYPQYPNPAYQTSNGYPGNAAYPGAVSTPGVYGSSAQPSPYGAQSSAYSTTYPAPPNTANSYDPNQYGANQYGPGTGATPAQGYPTATAQAYGTTAAQGYPTATAQAYGSMSAQGYATAPMQVYDARTGRLATGAANPYATRAVGMANTLYAGIAYEVQAIGPDGQTTPINTATYDFHTGDKFMVYYRPSLPGHMEVYNVNASGKNTLIDSSNMAAGQMVALGPYQFANQIGEESLLLVLSPCSNSQLLAATRDIVKADDVPQSSATSAAVRLGDCGAPTARGLDVHTRDIQKVAVEGTTSFALDPISPQELNSGLVTPRRAIIVFHHR